MQAVSSSDDDTRDSSVGEDTETSDGNVPYAEVTEPPSHGVEADEQALGCDDGGEDEDLLDRTLSPTKSGQDETEELSEGEEVSAVQEKEVEQREKDEVADEQAEEGEQAKKEVADEKAEEVEQEKTEVADEKAEEVEQEKKEVADEKAEAAAGAGGDCRKQTPKADVPADHPRSPLKNKVTEVLDMHNLDDSIDISLDYTEDAVEELEEERRLLQQDNCDEEAVVAASIPAKGEDERAVDGSKDSNESEVNSTPSMLASGDCAREDKPGVFRFECHYM